MQVSTPRFGLTVTIDPKVTRPSLQTTLNLLDTQASHFDGLAIKDDKDPISVDVKINDAGQIRAHGTTQRSGQFFMPEAAYAKAEDFWASLSQQVTTLAGQIRTSWEDWSQPLFDATKADLTALLNKSDLAVTDSKGDGVNAYYEFNTPSRSFVETDANNNRIRVCTNKTNLNLSYLNQPDGEQWINLDNNGITFNHMGVHSKSPLTADQNQQVKDLIDTAKQLAKKITG
jgi:hypothetical protein